MDFIFRLLEEVAASPYPGISDEVEALLKERT